MLRVPFRKNGSGMHLNQYTVSMYIKMRQVDCNEDFGLIASLGWDQFSKPKDNENCENALVCITESGGIGAQGSFGETSHVKDATWCVWGGGGGWPGGGWHAYVHACLCMSVNTRVMFMDACIRIYMNIYISYIQEESLHSLH